MRRRTEDGSGGTWDGSFCEGAYRPSGGFTSAEAGPPETAMKKGARAQQNGAAHQIVGRELLDAPCRLGDQELRCCCDNAYLADDCRCVGHLRRRRLT